MEKITRFVRWAGTRKVYFLPGGIGIIVMKEATLCFLIKGNPPDEILLGLKKIGFGKGKYVGFGGKIQAGETLERAAVREFEEEAGIKISERNIVKVGHLTFLFPAKPDWDMVVHVFLAKKWDGEPGESAEMKPRWFKINDIPFEGMWQDGPYWLPLVLEGKRIRGRFVFKDDNETLGKMKIEEL